MSEQEYAFDVTLCGVVRVKATSPEAALRAVYNVDDVDTDIRVGRTDAEDPVAVVTSVSVDREESIDLFEIGETVLDAPIPMNKG